MPRSKTDLLNLDLYPVTCRNLSRGRSNLEVLEGLIAGGARAVQLRDKELPDGEFLQMAYHFRQRTLESGMTLIINDRVDVCLAVGADGVHLGQDDFPIPEARKLLGPDKIIGASTHSVVEALRAVEQGADYINVGPIFATQTKEHLAGPVGVELYLEVREAVSEFFKMKNEECRQVPALDGEDAAVDYGESTAPQLVDFPITVMGGINLSNIDEVLRAGARRIAVVSAVVGSEDVGEAVVLLRKRITNYK
ncbi:MAG: thiamine phosphate synthase [bacterium]|nr:thiamine phosphate synthase [bacterium]